MAFIFTRLQVGDFDAWKPMFEADHPGARADALGWTLFRSTEDRNEVFIQIEYPTPQAAQAGREKLLASGVLDRFVDKSGPTVVEIVETVRR